jgi:hypothetical protein
MIHNKKPLLVHFMHISCVGSFYLQHTRLRSKKMARGCKATSVIAAGIIAVGLSAGSAHAVFINGSVGLGDAGITLSNLPASMVSALTNMTLGATAVPGPCTVNFVGCNANSPATADASTGFRCHDRIFLHTGRRHAVDLGAIVGSVLRTAPVNLGGNLITDSTIHRHRNGRRQPWQFRTPPLPSSISTRGNCVGKASCNAGTATATLAGDIERRGRPHHSRTRYACPSRPRLRPVSDSAGVRRPEARHRVDDDPAAAGFVISGVADSPTRSPLTHR